MHVDPPQQDTQFAGRHEYVFGLKIIAVAFSASPTGSSIASSMGSFIASSIAGRKFLAVRWASHLEPT